MRSRLDDLVSQRLQVASTPLALLREAAAARPTHPALVFLREVSDPHPRIVTYAALVQEVEAAASAFRASGLAAVGSCGTADAGDARGRRGLHRSDGRWRGVSDQPVAFE